MLNISCSWEQISIVNLGRSHEILSICINIYTARFFLQCRFHTDFFFSVYLCRSVSITFLLFGSYFIWLFFFYSCSLIFLFILSFFLLFTPLSPTVFPLSLYFTLSFSISLFFFFILVFTVFYILSFTRSLFLFLY